jgi:hypothetical protein
MIRKVKSAPGISLYVSDDPQGSNEVLGPAAPSFPDQDGALVYDLRVKLQAASNKRLTAGIRERNKTYDT